MKLTVNGVDIPVTSKLDIVVQVEGIDEILPLATIKVMGGKLDVYRSKVSTAGNLSVHMFGEGEYAP